MWRLAENSRATAPSPNMRRRSGTPPLARSRIEPGTRGRATMENSLTAVQRYGQSLWLDYIRRNLITSGELQRLIQDDGLRGVTSNPAIFEKAIAGSTDYRDLLSAADARKLDAKALYERIAI